MNYSPDHSLYDEVANNNNERHRTIGGGSRSRYETLAKDERTGGSKRPRPGSIQDFFFGFMYEEDLGLDDKDQTESTRSQWWTSNPTVWMLSLVMVLQTAVSSAGLLLVSHYAKTTDDPKTFVSQTTSYCVLGTAISKFINGPLIEKLGARNMVILFNLLVGVSFTILGLFDCVMFSAVSIEYFNSVQWACNVVLLPDLEFGIFITSVSARLGPLVGIPVTQYLLKFCSWRLVALLAAWSSCFTSSVLFHYIASEPNQLPRSRSRWLVLIYSQILPTVSIITKSSVFWIVALAHTGSSLVRTAERVLPTYFEDTQSFNSPLSYSLGMILGLLTVGQLFARTTEPRQRKYIIRNSLLLVIACCYGLSVTAFSALHSELNGVLQSLAVFGAGFGISVPFYSFPSLVANQFGHTGLFLAYVDGVAYGISSVVWGVIGQTSGWVFGWAAVALIVIVSGLIMVEFMEHYFCRQKHKGDYETIILA